MTHDPIVIGNRSYLYMGGLISANIFRCDVTNPLHIPIMSAGHDSERRNQLLRHRRLSAGSQRQPAGHLHGRQGSDDTRRRWSRSASTARSSENTRPPRQADRRATCRSVNGVTDTGLLAHPHGD